MAVNGNLLIIALNGTIIACAKTAEIETACETIEVASATEKQWKDFIAGRLSWTCNVNYLVADVNQTGTDLLRASTVYQLSICDRQRNVIVSGSAICTKVKVDANIRSLIHGYFQFKGKEALK